MIFLSGQKASGKSTVAKIFSNEGFFVLDQGPFWKEVIKDYRPEGMIAGDFFKYLKSIKGDDKWDDNVIIDLISNFYKFNKEKYKDIVIAGYRSFNGITYLKSQWEGKIYPERDIKIIYLDSDLNTTLSRFNRRENLNIDEVKLKEMYQSEIDRGVLIIREVADFSINTSEINIETLQSRIVELIYRDLQYKKELHPNENSETDIVILKNKRYSFDQLNNYECGLRDIDDMVKFARDSMGQPEFIKSEIENLRGNAYPENNTNHPGKEKF